jgi:hypothetical protein
MENSSHGSDVFDLMLRLPPVWAFTIAWKCSYKIFYVINIQTFVKMSSTIKGNIKINFTCHGKNRCKIAQTQVNCMRYSAESPALCHSQRAQVRSIFSGRNLHELQCRLAEKATSPRLYESRFGCDRAEHRQTAPDRRRIGCSIPRVLHPKSEVQLIASHLTDT